MPGKGCGKKGRKHTPIVSKKQQAFFGVEYERKKKGQKGKTKISKAVLKRHLEESKGKKLPNKKTTKKKGKS